MYVPLLPCVPTRAIQLVAQVTNAYRDGRMSEGLLALKVVEVSARAKGSCEVSEGNSEGRGIAVGGCEGSQTKVSLERGASSSDTSILWR